MRLGDVFDRRARSLGDQDAQGIHVECGQTTQNAPHAMVQTSVFRHSISYAQSRFYQKGSSDRRRIS
jgi:hypothetical protein